MAQILIVCTGNICRSPVGAALLQARLDERGLEGWSVASAGTWVKQKRGASQYSIEIMTEHGLDISEHQAEMLEYTHMKKSDLVLCMESGHADALKAEFPIYAKKVYLISEMVERDYSISDPYGQTKDAYYRMVNDLAGIIDVGLNKIIEEAESRSASQ